MDYIQDHFFKELHKNNISLTMNYISTHNSYYFMVTNKAGEVKECRFADHKSKYGGIDIDLYYDMPDFDDEWNADINEDDWHKEEGVFLAQKLIKQLNN